MAETLRSRVARLLRQRMDSNPGLDTQMKVHKASGLAQSTIQRLLAQDQAATVDVLDQLAIAFGFKQAQHFLLDEDEVHLVRTFSQLSEADKRSAMGFMEVALANSRLHQPSIIGFSATLAKPMRQAAPPPAPARYPSFAYVGGSANLERKHTEKK